MQHLPTGTVTLLFTDIEGSTYLLQRLGDRFPGVLAEYRTLLRTVFQTYGGHEVDAQGDSFFVAFAHATNAVTAATEIQRILAAHHWLDDASILTRIGLHTGEPQLSAEGYVGLDVHHAARIMGVAHGGSGSPLRDDIHAGSALSPRRCKRSRPGSASPQGFTTARPPLSTCY